MGSLPTEALVMQFYPSEMPRPHRRRKEWKERIVSTVTEGSEEKEDLNIWQIFLSQCETRIVNGSFESSIHPNHAFTIRLAEAVNVAATNQFKVSVYVC